MNTPDNRPEAVLDRILEKAGVIPPHTPDTEWERQLRIDFEVAYGRMPENFEHVPSVHISDWWLEKLSSHTTYWKERVRKEVEGMKENIPPYPHEGAHGQAITLSAQRGYQDALDTLLDNLK